MTTQAQIDALQQTLILATAQASALTPDIPIVTPPLPLPPPLPGILDAPVIYDGQGGLTSDGPWGGYASVPVWQFWGNKGGDWADADGVAQGSKPIESANIGAGTTSVNLLIPPGETQIVLRCTGMVEILSRESGGAAIADTGLDPSTVYPIGDRKQYTVGGKYMAYLRLSAGGPLTLNLAKVWTPGVLEVYRFAVHTQTPGTYYPDFSSPYFMSECFDPQGIPTYLKNQLWGHDPLKQLSIATRADGSRALRLRLDPTSNGIANAMILLPNYGGTYGREARRIAFQYDCTVLDDWLPSITEGGKFFAGFAGPTKPDDTQYWPQGVIPGSCGTPLVGGGANSTGRNGWSFRGQFHPRLPVGHPHYDRLRIGTYAYYGEQAGWNNPNGANGETWNWSQYGGGMLTPGRTHRIAGEIVVNDPDVRNGVLIGWIDGRMAFYRDDILIRRSPPYDLTALGVVTDLLCKGVYINPYHGGHQLPKGKGGIEISNFIASEL